MNCICLRSKNLMSRIQDLLPLKMVEQDARQGPFLGKMNCLVEITKLSRTDYEEREVNLCPPLKASGKGWNADGMHHVDLQQISNGEWIACVDGNQRQLVF